MSKKNIKKKVNLENLPDPVELLKKSKLSQEQMPTHGFTHSGYIYVGDPAHLSSSMYGENGDTISNPFSDFDQFISLTSGYSLYNFSHDGLEVVESKGKGVAIQTHKLGARYDVEDIRNEQGQVIEIRIKVR